MPVSKTLDSIFGVLKALGLIFRGQQSNSGMDTPVLRVGEYPPGNVLFNMKVNVMYTLDETYI